MQLYAISERIKTKRLQILGVKVAYALMTLPHTTCISKCSAQRKRGEHRHKAPPIDFPMVLRALCVEKQRRGQPSAAACCCIQGPRHSGKSPLLIQVVRQMHIPPWPWSDDNLKTGEFLFRRSLRTAISPPPRPSLSRERENQDPSRWTSGLRRAGSEDIIGAAMKRKPTWSP